MCAACGSLGGGFDWTDGIDGAPTSVAGLTRLAMRQRRLSLVNGLLAPLRVRLFEQGRQVVVRGSTGQTRIVTDLAHVWAAAEAIAGRPVDPLDDVHPDTLGRAGNHDR
jgi:hypothetical protein